MPVHSTKVPNVAISSLELVKKLQNSDASAHNKATMVQLYFDAALNDEMDLLVESINDLEIDERDPLLMAPITRGDLRGTVTACVAACRKKFAELLREHRRDIE